ncbi:MAG: hypothetical protein CV089_15650 [Nitrospira sp. WS110]|nr:hypothetical protein [Nitrospira sp. WS110]
MGPISSIHDVVPRSLFCLESIQLQAYRRLYGMRWRLRNATWRKEFWVDPMIDFLLQVVRLITPTVVNFLHPCEEHSSE